MKTESKELTVPERASVALCASKCEAELKALIAASKEITVITNAAGREECHSSAMRAVKARTGIAGAGKSVREDSTAFAKAVIAEENRLIAIIEPEEIRLKDLRDAWDEKIAAEKAEKARIEEERQTRIQWAIDAIRNAPAMCLVLNSSGTKAALDALAETDLSEDVFADRRDEAEYIMGQSIHQIESMIAGKKAQEQLSAQIESQRIENERIASELAARQEEADAAQRASMRDEAERQRVQAEELAKQRAELELMRKQIADQQAEIDRKEKAEADAVIAAAAEVDRQRVAADVKAESDAIKARRDAERDSEDVAIEERLKDAQLAESAQLMFTSTTIKQVDSVEMVSISMSEYTRLCDDSLMLNCLRNAGVDNWDGFDHACDEYNSINGDE